MASIFHCSIPKCSLYETEMKNHLSTTQKDGIVDILQIYKIEWKYFDFEWNSIEMWSNEFICWFVNIGTVSSLSLNM